MKRNKPQKINMEWKGRGYKGRKMKRTRGGGSGKEEGIEERTEEKAMSGRGRKGNGMIE